MVMYIPHISLYSSRQFTIGFFFGGGEVIGRQLEKMLLTAAMSL